MRSLVSIGQKQNMLCGVVNGSSQLLTPLGTFISFKTFSSNNNWLLNSQVEKKDGKTFLAVPRIKRKDLKVLAKSETKLRKDMRVAMTPDESFKWKLSQPDCDYQVGKIHTSQSRKLVLEEILKKDQGANLFNMWLACYLVSYCMFNYSR